MLLFRPVWNRATLLMSSSVMSRYVQRVQNISFLAELPIMFGMLSFKGTNQDTDKH